VTQKLVIINRKMTQYSATGSKAGRNIQNKLSLLSRYKQFQCFTYAD